MNKKSKFVTFILSFLPGLGHIYLGYTERAFVFFLLFFGAILGVGGVAALFHVREFILILGLALPIIWLISLVDTISLADRTGYSKSNDLEQATEGKDLRDDNKKLIAVGLSVIPGAGHMYLGLQREGLVLMSIFFFALFLMSWLNMSVFLFLLPIIWFYSLFDALHSLEDKENRVQVESHLFSWLDENPGIIGWGLIGMGVLAVLNRIVAPLLTWQARNYLQTGIVALVLIASGIKLVIGPKEAVSSSEDENTTEESLENEEGEDEYLETVPKYSKEEEVDETCSSDE